MMRTNNNKQLDLSEALFLDMNTLLAGNTLSYNVPNTNKSFSYTNSNSNLFLTNDYLNYFSSSLDNFVISLNSTSANNTISFNFYSTKPNYTIKSINL